MQGSPAEAQDERQRSREGDGVGRADDEEHTGQKPGDRECGDDATAVPIAPSRRHQGKRAEARRAIEQAVKLDPRNEEAKKALK